MIRTLNPYNSTAKTAEIMSRYRPIAPKPEPPVNPMFERPSMSQKMRESPYLRNLWPQLQARPTRSRKRGRPGFSPAALKRPRTHLVGFSTPSHVTSPAKNLSMHGFTHSSLQLPVPNMAPSFAPLNGGFGRAISTTADGLMTLPLLPCPPPQLPVVPNDFNCLNPCGGNVVFDLNTSVVAARIPEEKDLLQQLQRAPANTTNVISPQPVRPIGSSISVRCMRDDLSPIPEVQILKKPEEVEEEMESETLPAVISDSNNKIRMANSAYKEMVGQPECPWLNSMVTCGASVGNRISGEVMLHLSDSKVPVASNGFSCWASIEWGSAGNKSSVNAFCDATRLACESKDYLFTWRFHTNTEASKPNV